MCVTRYVTISLAWIKPRILLDYLPGVGMMALDTHPLLSSAPSLKEEKDTDNK